MLKRQTAYTVTLKDFLERHSLPVHHDLAERLKPFDEAVKYLNGTPLNGNRRLDIQLEETPDKKDYQVLARKQVAN